MSDEAASDLLVAVKSWCPEAVALFEGIKRHIANVEALDPIVVDHRGCLLNRRVLESSHLEEWFEDRFSHEQREYVLNHVHLWDIAWMPNEDEAANEVTATLREFMPTLADYWRWSLARQADAPVEVWTADDPEEYGPTIGFGYKR